MRKLNLKKKKGFTLIELIIVVAILGILSAIAIPKFGSAQKDAKIAADKANAKMIASAVTMAVTKGLSVTTNTDVNSELNSIPKPQYFDNAKFGYTYSDTTGVVVYIQVSSTNNYKAYPDYDATAVISTAPTGLVLLN